MRIGHGYDVHRLVPNRKLVLGGVEICYERGLLGHSDADVLTHALMDALLGAAGQGDIGKMFPDNDPKYQGVSSLLLLEQVIERLQSVNLYVGNADMTILAQQPKLAGHIPEMQKKLSMCMHIDETKINIKATTEEGLGFTGAGEGIAAHAVVLLEEMR